MLAARKSTQSTLVISSKPARKKSSKEILIDHDITMKRSSWTNYKPAMPIEKISRKFKKDDGDVVVIANFIDAPLICHTISSKLESSKKKVAAILIRTTKTSKSREQLNKS